MATQVASVRQPFGPVNGSRLQNLGSLKNRQNALSSPIKRKATSFEDDDSENIDPIIFLSPKRSKCPDGSSKDTSFVKPTNYFLTKAPPSPNDFSSLKPTVSPRRPILTARSPAPRLNTSISKSAPLSAPAGRSPTRKRVGILNRRKTGSTFARVDPPKFSTSSTSSLGFSIDAALSGTIPSYRRPAPVVAPVAKVNDFSVIPTLHQPESKDSWFFDIHEDTEEELATNLMEHGACTLDISSDEECAAREKDLRGKENVPPPDDISQTRTLISGVAATESSMAEVKARVKASRRKLEEGAIEVDRSPLGDLVAEEFWAEGCDGESAFLVPAEPSEEEVEQEQEQVQVPESVSASFDFTAEVKGKGKEIDIDALMQKDDYEFAPKAALLQPLEKAEDNFELWESGSAKGGE